MGTANGGAVSRRSRTAGDLERMYQHWKKKRLREAKMTRRTGTCEVCGRENMKVKKLYGMIACGSCSVLMTRVKNNPEIVMDAMRKVHGDRFFGSGEAAADPAREVLDGVRGALNAGESIPDDTLPDMVTAIIGQRDSFYEEVQELMNILEVHSGGNLPDRARDVMEERDRDRSRVTALERELREVKEECQEAMHQLRDIIEAGPDENIIEVAERRMLQAKELRRIFQDQRSSPAPADAVPVNRLLADPDLLAAVNTLADKLREG